MTHRISSSSASGIFGAMSADDLLDQFLAEASGFRKLVQYSQAKGKTIEDVEFSIAPGYHNISINFRDKTCLNFSVETGFTVETDYSDWKTGNRRVLRACRPIHNRL